jgi:hypothetical protein
VQFEEKRGWNSPQANFMQRQKLRLRERGRILRHQQKIEFGLRDGNEFVSWSQRNATVACKEEVVIDVTLTAEPKMFDLNLGPNSTRGAYDSAVAKIVKLFAALRIHTLGNHVRPLG